jgi:dTDP-4-dehydrorhamnose reductase
MKVLALVLGAGGQLGEAMTEQLSVRHEVVARSRLEVDVTRTDAVCEVVRGVFPDVIINCTAYTNVDRAEQEPLEALAVNAWAVRTLARIANEIDATLVHYGTDFVFDGDTARPYAEKDPPNPRSTYGTSKLLGEWFAQEAKRHYILRVESLFGGSRARSTIDRMAGELRAGRPVRAFGDRTVSPSFVDDVVDATGRLISAKAPFGIYHCVNSGWTTWAGVAREVARLVGAPEDAVQEIPVADAGLTVNRPQFAALSNARLSAAGIRMPSWQSALERYLSPTVG